MSNNKKPTIELFADRLVPDIEDDETTEEELRRARLAPRASQGALPPRRSLLDELDQIEEDADLVLGNLLGLV
jgi:hypothetical protein